MLMKKNNDFKFIFYGPTEEELKDNIGDEALYERIANCICIKGRIPQQEVYENIVKADFTIFLREKRLSSDAGFPTKLAESMAVGTPVIANDTGSIGKYLHDRENGYLLPNLSVECLLEVFEKIKNLSVEDYVKMRKDARITAEKYFDYRCYLQGIKHFFLEEKNDN